MFDPLSLQNVKTFLYLRKRSRTVCNYHGSTLKLAYKPIGRIVDLAKRFPK